VNLLAIELSSRVGSLAILSDATVRAECELAEEDRRSRGLFRVLPDLCDRAGIGLDDLDLLAPGRGPGSYTGLRLAMTVAQAVALPASRTVYPVDSGEALAWEIMQSRKNDVVAVIGDARRERLWLGVFEQGNDGPMMRQPWAVLHPRDVPRWVPDGALAVSSDWSLLAARPEFEALRTLRWIESDRFPRARWLGALAETRHRHGAPAAPPTPIYMHPAVTPRA